MSTIPESSHKSTVSPGAEREWSPWAAGMAVFAGVLMITVGFFQFFQGLVALIDDKFYVVTANYTFEFDVTTWGWIHLVIGALVALTGYFVVRGALWARIVAMILVSLAAIANFLWVPYYPVWSLFILSLNVLAIWALAVYRPMRAQ